VRGSGARAPPVFLPPAAGGWKYLFIKNILLTRLPRRIRI